MENASRWARTPRGRTVASEGLPRGRWRRRVRRWAWFDARFERLRDASPTRDDTRCSFVSTSRHDSRPRPVTLALRSRHRDAPPTQLGTARRPRKPPDTSPTVRLQTNVHSPQNYDAFRAPPAVARALYMAEAPATSSIISEVIFAWRLRLYSRERDLESSFALSVALDIAFMRAASSEARDSWSARRICEFM